MKRLITVLTFISLLMGCHHSGQEILQPDEILQEEELLSSEDSLQSSQILSGLRSEEGIFILTVDQDLFYLDPTLSQYKLSDQVAYFDYDAQTNSIKIQKKDQRWIIWFLDKMKPEMIPVVGDVKLLGRNHQIVYTDSANQQLSIIKDGESHTLFTGDIKIFDTTLNGELIIIQDQSDTLRVLNSSGHIVYECEAVHAYRIDKDNQVMMIWVDDQGIVLKLYEDSVTTYKVVADLTDWLMFPTYSSNFETMVQFSDLNLETGIGTMSVSSNLNEERLDILDVLNFDVMKNGTYVFYLTDKHELYGLDVESLETTFLGSGVGQLNVHHDLNGATFKSNDVLYSIKIGQAVQVMAEDVYQYDYNGAYMVYTNSIHDLYLQSHGLTSKIDENVQQFALGRQGVYYNRGDQIIYKPFSGPKEVIVDSNGSYKNVFFANTQLYHKEAEVSTLYGYWFQEGDGEIILYFFDADGQIEKVTKRDGQWSYLKGQYDLMSARGTVLSLLTRYVNESESYLTISLLDAKLIQLADQDQIFELNSVSEQEALTMIEAAKTANNKE